MKEENAKSLDNLAKTSYRSGVFICFLGVLVGFVHVINQNYAEFLTGILIFITGYGYAKIAGKVRHVLKTEAT